jgi:hypothetical protein
LDFEIFKEEIDKLKQAKLALEDIIQKEYEEAYTKMCTEILELVRMLAPYIDYAAEKFNLSEDVKNIECTVSYAYTASIRWYKYLVKAVFLYSGHGESIMFTLDDLAFKKNVLSKDQVQWLGDAFNPKNLKYFVEDLLHKLESNKLYVK